jgi:uncharacterized membrane protein
MLQSQRMKLQVVLRLLMATFYLTAGILHLATPSGFIRIVPGFVPWPSTVVLLTGIFEIVGATGLMLPLLRRAAGIGLATYAVCV